ncbi:MAG: putative DNA binding domain-containing protein [Bacteroidales bacterium]|nr:putative DNA binding domain-containing protein [Bacteroidales bacterium]
MTEQELQHFLLKKYPKEDINCEWKEMKNLKNSFSSDEGSDVISYLSGISNMEGGNLVIGVKDATLEIVGTDLSKFNYTSTSVVYKMVELCPNLPSEGLTVEEYVTDDTQKVVWVIVIPKHLPRRPVFAHRKKWQRIKDVLVELRGEREDVILKEEMVPYDWSAEIVEGATLSDLDDEAIQKALSGYCERYPDKAEQARQWSTTKFLDKARVTKQGKITRTALLLLGKAESVHFLNHPAEMVWRLQTGEERAAKIFYPPFLLTAVDLRSAIRNYQIKIYPSNSSLPSEVMKYDQRSILEALHNCILHQDYIRGERIIVTENADSIIFKNVGSFYEGRYFDYIEGDRTPTKYRNPFLQTAMVNLKMIDSQGFGIHDMFEGQRVRYLPMPDYDKSTKTHVVLEIPGQVINVEYSTALMENSNLELTTVALLDRVQRNKPISKEARIKLRELNLIEGRHPHIIISSRVAQITHNEVEYTTLKGFDDGYYKDLIIKFLKDHKQLNRKQINNLLMGKLPEIFNENQKKNHIDYLLRCLRKSGRIYVGKNKLWRLVKDAQ